MLHLMFKHTITPLFLVVKPCHINPHHTLFKKWYIFGICGIIKVQQFSHYANAGVLARTQS